MMSDILHIKTYDEGGINLEKVLKIGQLFSILSAAQKCPYNLHFYPGSYISAILAFFVGALKK